MKYDGNGFQNALRKISRYRYAVTESNAHTTGEPLRYLSDSPPPPKKIQSLTKDRLPPPPPRPVTCS